MAARVRRDGVERARLMKRAAAALGKRRRKKAIGIFRQVLAADPEDAEVHRKIAPLLARSGEVRAALVSYRKAADALLRRGFDDKAIGLLRAAVGDLPREFELWRGMATLQAKRGQKADAVASLLEGRHHFRSRRDRGLAIQLLSQAHRLDPGSFPVAYDLACLLGKAGRRAEALHLLDRLASRATPRELRRVRWRQLWMAPGPGSLWRFLFA